MTDEMLSFVTPYWAGREMMTIHLRSIRKFCPNSPILISKKGGGRDEMEEHRLQFAVQYWIEDCDYEEALVRLLKRCETEYVCILDHDTVLLSSLDPLLGGLAEGRYDLVGIEDRIWEPGNGIRMRYAPGYMDASFLVFNWKKFVQTWGVDGVKWDVRPNTPHDEYHYGICQKLKRHKYLLPFHASKYGLGNLLKDGDTPILWHQWYATYRERLVDTPTTNPGLRLIVPTAQQGQTAFLADYPNLDFSDLTPAWTSGGLVKRCAAILDRWKRCEASHLITNFLSKVSRRLRRVF